MPFNVAFWASMWVVSRQVVEILASFPGPSRFPSSANGSRALCRSGANGCVPGASTRREVAPIRDRPFVVLFHKIALTRRSVRALREDPDDGRSLISLCKRSSVCECSRGCSAGKCRGRISQEPLRFKAGPSATAPARSVRLREDGPDDPATASRAPCGTSEPEVHPAPVCAATIITVPGRSTFAPISASVPGVGLRRSRASSAARPGFGNPRSWPC